MLYLLDTDILTLLMKGNQQVSEHVALHKPEELCISIISVEEQLSGWYSQIRRARNKSEQESAYRHLLQTVQFFGRISIMPFTLPAIERWEQLRRSKMNVSSMDLKIASIAIENQAMMVSRNVRDFRRVPGLTVEDWSN